MNPKSTFLRIFDAKGAFIRSWVLVFSGYLRARGEILWARSVVVPDAVLDLVVPGSNPSEAELKCHVDDAM